MVDYEPMKIAIYNFTLFDIIKKEKETPKHALRVNSKAFMGINEDIDQSSKKINTNCFQKLRGRGRKAAKKSGKSLSSCIFQGGELIHNSGGDRIYGILNSISDLDSLLDDLIQRNTDPSNI